MTENRRFTQLYFRHIAAVAIVVAVAFSAICWLWRQTILEQITDVLAISDPIDKADAIVILGGGIYDRSGIAADFYRSGIVKRILISNVGSSRMTPAEPYLDISLTRQVLREHGVPDSAVETFGVSNHSTYDEAVALRSWNDRNAATSFIIPTEFLFSRRVRWIFNREFAGRGVRISVFPFQNAHYNSKWWKTAEGRRAFRIELMKLIYYRMRY